MSRKRGASNGSDIAKIPLGNSKVALVDAVDYQSVSGYRWKDTGAAVQMAELPLGYLALFLMCPTGEEEVIHKDGDYLNCRRANLCVINAQEPLMVTLDRSRRRLLEKQASRRNLSVDEYLGELILKAEESVSTSAPSPLP
jgi:hypothetical protein